MNYTKRPKREVKKTAKATEAPKTDARYWQLLGLTDEAARSAAQSEKEFEAEQFAFRGTAEEAVAYLNAL